METKSDNQEEKPSHGAEGPKEEPLGSLTISDIPELKGQQLRSSARVFKKMKLDSAPLTVPEKNEKKEDVKQEKKKCFKPLWTSDDKTLFFEALNEYGKDFESIQLYLSNKFRKKGVPAQFVKTKDQIRHLYYRTWAKISKYLKFADAIKKPTQELYGLINYGELRRKVGSVNEKYLLKLNKLIYKGSIVLSIKGKKIRIKTPFCRALRKLNQLDDKYEEIKLPNRLTVELRPKDMTSFLRVQSTAQNPRLNTCMSLQKRLSSLIDCLSKKWQSVDAGMYDKALISSNPVTMLCVPTEKEVEANRERLNPLLRLTPPLGSKINMPSISMGEYFTPQSICFNSHESRLGISNYSSFCNYNTYKLLNKSSKKGPRSRTDSISDKSEKSPHKLNSHNEDDNCDNMDTTEPVNEVKKEGATVSIKEGGVHLKESNSIKEGGRGKALNGTIKQEVEEISTEVIEKQEEHKTNDIENAARKERQERINTIRKGWTIKDSESITMGEIYLMLGINSKVVLEYSWDPLNLTQSQTENKDFVKTETETDMSDSNSSIYPSVNMDLSESLLKLLSVAKLHYRKNVIKCPCGHVCGAKNNAQLKKDVETKIRKILTDIDKCTEESEEKTSSEETIVENQNVGAFVAPPVYLAPKIQIAPYYQHQPNAMQLAAQIASIKRLPRYSNRKGQAVKVSLSALVRKNKRQSSGVYGEKMSKGKVRKWVRAFKDGRITVHDEEPSRRPRAKQVVVERQLPLLPNNLESGHQIVRMSIISKEDSNPVPLIVSEISTDPKQVPPTLDTFRSQSQQASTSNIKPQEVLEETLKGCIIDSEPSSPSRILKEGENWINCEVGDYSLSSLLGHLESPMKSETNLLNEDSRMSQDVDAQLRSMLTQNSIDFSANFADLAAEVAKDNRCELG